MLGSFQLRPQTLLSSLSWAGFAERSASRQQNESCSMVLRRAGAFTCLVSLLAVGFLYSGRDIVEKYKVDEMSAATKKAVRRKQRKERLRAIKSLKELDQNVIGAPALNEKLFADVKRKSKRKAHRERKVTVSIADIASKTSPTEAERKTQGKIDENHYHNNAVFITHYHKTGYVLSRELMFLLQQIEVDVNRPDLNSKFAHHVKFEVSGVEHETGERFAFDQVGNWVRSAFHARQHNSVTKCPDPVKGGRGFELALTEDFSLRDSTMYAQESPDLFCSDQDILESLALSHKGGTKIIHFVRNPYEMVLSNYFYHSQDPTPEKWVHNDDPCEHLYDDGNTLGSYVLPTLAKESGKSLDFLTSQLDGIGSMCQELFRSQRSLQNSTFYDHLVQLDKYDGLRLSTAQMVAASGKSNGYWAGGDVLRMANNIIRFKRLKEASDENNKVELYTVIMGDFIKNMANSTYDFLNFVFGEDDTTIPKERLWEAAKYQEDKYAKKKEKDTAHVTQTNEEDQKVKSMLKEQLQTDPHLSFILNMTEALVNEALAA